MPLLPAGSTPELEDWSVEGVPPQEAKAKRAAAVIGKRAFLFMQTSKAKRAAPAKKIQLGYPPQKNSSLESLSHSAIPGKAFSIFFFKPGSILLLREKASPITRIGFFLLFLRFPPNPATAAFLKSSCGSAKRPRVCSSPPKSQSESRETPPKKTKIGYTDVYGKRRKTTFLRRSLNATDGLHNKRPDPNDVLNLNFPCIRRRKSRLYRRNPSRIRSSISVWSRNGNRRSGSRIWRRGPSNRPWSLRQG